MVGCGCLRRGARGLGGIPARASALASVTDGPVRHLRPKPHGGPVRHSGLAGREALHGHEAEAATCVEAQGLLSLTESPG